MDERRRRIEAFCFRFRYKEIINVDADVNASSLPEAEDALVNVDPALVMREFRADVDATLDGMRVTVKSRAFPFAQNHANWETISLLIPDMQKSIAISGLLEGK